MLAQDHQAWWFVLVKAVSEAITSSQLGSNAPMSTEFKLVTASPSELSLKTV
jgi:hypothetical protein